MSLCLSFLKDRAKAEDAAQEIFIKAYQALGRFEAASSFSTWLHRISSNHCLDLLRRQAREKTESLDALVEAEGEKVRLLVTTAEEISAAEESSDLVKRVLDQISPQYRMILTLREVQGLSYQEMAQTLECSLDSVKAKLKRARHEFTEVLRHFSLLRSV